MVHELAKILSDPQVAKLLVTSFPVVFCPNTFTLSDILPHTCAFFKVLTWKRCRSLQDMVLANDYQLQPIIRTAFRFHTNQLHYKLWLPHKILAFILHAPHNAFIITRSCMIPNIQAMMKTLIPVHSIDYSHNCHIVMLHFSERTNLPISHSCPHALKLF